MILTTTYGLKKPEDTDSADLRVFVGDNMDIIETELANLNANINTEPTDTGGGLDPNSFPRNLFNPFVYLGFNATIDAVNLAQINLDYSIAYVKQADNTLARIFFNNPSYTTSVASTTYYLDVLPDGTVNWSTTASTIANALPVLQVTTDVNGYVATSTDVATRVAEFFPFSDAGLSAPVNGMNFGNFQINFNSATNSLDFNYVGA
jgi:hypothetical protein